ncbi:RICIN domain-containing protein, partial [Ruminococcus sp. zg-921]
MKRIISVVLSFLVVISCFTILGTVNVGATQSRTYNFNKSYSITGNGAEDVVNVARAQLGKTGSQLGYTEQWCADFVSDCAILANQSDAIPASGYCPTLRYNIINSGGYYVSKSTAQPGDIVFYGNNGADHVEIVYAASNGNVSTYGGNSGSGGSLYARSVRKHPTQTQTIAYIVRPNYRGGGCNCSESYAGDYTVTTRSQPLNMRNSHGGGSVIASIPKGTIVYVSKADGNWAHVEWNGYSGYCSMEYLTRVNNNPAPTGYTISISSTGFYESEIQTVTITPYDSNISNYKLHFVAPDGRTADPDLGDKNYFRFACRGVYGTWKVYAEVSNSGGTFRGATDNGCLSFVIKKLNWGTQSNLGSDFYAQIGSAVSDNNVLTHASLSDYTNVYMSKNTNSDNQIFCFVRQSDGSYVIKSRKNSNYCIDVNNNGYVSGTNVGVYSENGTDAQKWMIYSAGNGYYCFRPINCNAAILDVEGASPEEGTNIRLYTYNGTNAQKFKINKLGSASLSLSKSSLTFDLANNPTQTINVTATGLLPSKYTFSALRNTDVFTTKWGARDGNTCPCTITAKRTGDYTIDFSLKDTTNGETILTKKTLSVTIKCSHNYTTKVVSPTCSEKGYTLHKCSICGDTYKDDYTNAIEQHVFGEWKVTKEATCIKNGSKMRMCFACGKNETKTIPVKGHSYGAWITTQRATCTLVGTKTRTCSSCDKKETQTIPAIGHKYVEKIIAPTTTTQGYTLHTCAVCGYNYKDIYTDPLKPINPDTPQIVVDTKTAGPGGTVTVNVSMKNNPGINGWAVSVGYDSNALELKSCEQGDFGEITTSNIITNNPYHIQWFNLTNVKTNGNLFTLTFVIKSNAKEGTYPITVTYDKEEICNDKEENVHFDVMNGAVKVAAHTPGDINEDGKVNLRDVIRL